MNKAAKRHQKKLARKAALKRRSPPARSARSATHVAPANYLSELTQKGLQMHLAGKMREAEAIYRQVLEAKPGHADANHLLGGLAHQAGNHERAAELISKAVAKAPKQPVYRNSLGNALHALGRLDDAAASYRKAIAIQPDYAEAYNNFANTLVSQGRREDALAGYNKAIAFNPDYAEAHYNLANALQAMGRPEDALVRYENALEIKPDYTDAHGNLANVLIGLGRLDDAIACCRKALAASPGSAEIHNNLGNALEALGRRNDAAASYRSAIRINSLFAEAHNNLGNVLNSTGQVDEAIASYECAININPDHAEAHYNLGAVLQFLGRSQDALAHYRRAIALKPENDSVWSALVACLETATFATADQSLFDDLLSLAERPAVRSNSIALPVISALRHLPEFSRVLERTGPGRSPDAIDAIDAAGCLAAIPLFLRVIEQSHINDLEVEHMLTLLRRGLLDAALAGTTDDRALPFWAALALHCFTNEYVFSESKEEQSGVEELERRIGALAEDGAEVPASLLAALATYRPLHLSPWAACLKKGTWTDEIQQVIVRQIIEPEEERSLRPEITCLTAIDGAVSKEVREQYEENPYPRWIKVDIERNPRSVTDVLSNAPLGFDLGEHEPIENPEILIAGCGTGQHALVPASNYKNAHVLAVDLSLSSLTYADRKTRELGLSNIEYAQADITELGVLDRKFDLIESSGVLHHLGDPMLGWRVLVDLLRPNGFMKIGLYSETAREPVVRARALIAEKGYGSSAADIRRCRQEILEMAEEEGSAMAKLVEFRDFYSLSECRDLIFHVQEHRFTLPRIEAALASLKLEFLGFEMRDQAVLRAFKKTYPQAGATTSLPLWHEFECDHPDTFWGMYQFWCRKA